MMLTAEALRANHRYAIIEPGLPDDIVEVTKVVKCDCEEKRPDMMHFLVKGERAPRHLAPDAPVRLIED